MGIGAEFSAILGDLANLSGLVNNLFNLGAKQDTAASTLANTQVLIVGMAVLQQRTAQMAAQLDAIQSDVNNLQSNLGYAISQTQQASQPVTLPSVAPSTFLDATNGGTAEAVWTWQDFTSTYLAYQALDGLFNYITAIRDSIGVPIRASANFVLSGSLFNPAVYPWPSTPELSPASIRSSDANRLAWLNRVAGTFVWTLAPSNNLYSAAFGTTAGAIITCTLSESEFAWYRESANGVLPGTNLPPVWPGLANVTLGAPVTMTPPGDNITVPCDGVIIAVTGTPSWAGSFSFGTAISYRNVGAVTFTDDNGEQEFAQTFSWTSGVYCPKSMRTAAGFAYRAAIGVSGTVTPFTIN